MYPNLEAEQTRHGHTDSQIAEVLGISLQEYREQKASKTIQLPEAQRLAAVYNISTEYLFETDT